MAANPAFASTIVRTEVVQISVANTARDGTGAMENLFTAGANASRIERLTIQATGNTVAGMIRFFIRKNSITRFWKEYQVTLINPTGTTLAFTLTINNVALLMASGTELFVSTNAANTFNVFAEAGDY